MFRRLGTREQQRRLLLRESTSFRGAKSDYLPMVRHNPVVGHLPDFAMLASVTLLCSVPVACC